MSIGASGSPEFVSPNHLKHRQLRGGRDLAVFLGLCSDRNRTKAISYISTRCKLTSKHDGGGCHDDIYHSCVAIVLLR